MQATIREGGRDSRFLITADSVSDTANAMFTKYQCRQSVNNLDIRLPCDYRYPYG
jgi:hypothetical protein